YPVGPSSFLSTLAAVSPGVVVAQGGYLYGQGSAMMIVTRNGGRTWATRTTLPGEVVQITRGDGSVWGGGNPSDPGKPERLGFRPRNRAGTGTRVAIPPHLGNIYSLDVAPDGSVFLSTESGGLYRSDDDGQSWQTIRRRGTVFKFVQFLSAQQGF